MHFALSQEQNLIIETTRGFVEKELYPHEAEIERTGHLEMDVIQDVQKKPSKRGYMRRTFLKNLAAQA